MKLTLFEGKTELQQEAINLHYEIRKNGEIAAVAMVEFAKGLKTMRDKYLYKELGFETFEEYVENAVGLKQRQAYNYIQALESFGEADLQLNANLGITKLKILGEISRFERAEFIENNDVAEMSTRELKEAVDKLKAAEEQITFLTAEKDKLAKENEDLEGMLDDSVAVENELEIVKKSLEEKESELIEKERELKEAHGKPVQVSVREPSADEIAKLTEKAVKAARKETEEKYKAELKKAMEDKDRAVAQADSESKKKIAELEAKYKLTIATAEKERTAAADRLALVEKNAKISSNPETLKFSFYFEEVQNNIKAMKDIISRLEDADTAFKLCNALSAVKKLLDVEPPFETPSDAVQQRFDEVNN